MGGDAPFSQKLQFVDKVFTRMDNDGDGVVSKDEDPLRCQGSQKTEGGVAHQATKAAPKMIQMAH